MCLDRDQRCLYSDHGSGINNGKWHQVILQLHKRIIMMMIFCIISQRNSVFYNVYRQILCMLHKSDFCSACCMEKAGDRELISGFQNKKSATLFIVLPGMVLGGKVSCTGECPVFSVLFRKWRFWQRRIPPDKKIVVKHIVNNGSPLNFMNFYSCC